MVMDLNETVDSTMFEEALAKPSLKGAVLKLMHILRFAGVGTPIKRSKAFIKRNRSFRLWEAPSHEEEVFVARVMSSKPLMQLASRVLQPLCNAEAAEDASEMSCLATQAIHQSRKWTARAAWRESMDAGESSRLEAEQCKHKLESLQAQFHGARADYLKEITSLRDKVRVRGNPEDSIRNDSQNLDITVFFDPMSTLQPPELDFALKVIAEKLKMIFETDPRVTRSIDFGQVGKVHELAVNKEVANLKEALLKKSFQLAELEKQHRLLQRCSSAAAPVPEPVPEQGSPLSDTIIAKLKEKLATLRETQRQTEYALKQQYSSAENLTLERDEVRLALRESEETQAALRTHSEKTSVALNELQAKLDQSATTGRGLIEQARMLSQHNTDLTEANLKLRAIAGRMRGAPQVPEFNYPEIEMQQHSDSKVLTARAVEAGLSVPELGNESCRPVRAERLHELPQPWIGNAHHSETMPELVDNYISESDVAELSLTKPSLAWTKPQNDEDSSTTASELPAKFQDDDCLSVSDLSEVMSCRAASTERLSARAMCQSFGDSSTTASEFLAKFQDDDCLSMSDLSDVMSCRAASKERLSARESFEESGATASVSLTTWFPRDEILHHGREGAQDDVCIADLSLQSSELERAVMKSEAVHVRDAVRKNVNGLSVFDAEKMRSPLEQSASTFEVGVAETVHNCEAAFANGEDAEQAPAAVGSSVILTGDKIKQRSLGLPREDAVQLQDASQMPQYLHASSCKAERATELSICSSSLSSRNVQGAPSVQGCSLSRVPCLPQAHVACDLSVRPRTSGLAKPDLGGERSQNRGRGSQFSQLRENSIHMEVAGVGSNTLHTSSPTSPPVARQGPRPPSSRRPPPGQLRSPQSLAVVVSKATAEYLPNFAAACSY